MPTYLYCVLPGTAEVPAVMPIGVGGASTRALRANALAAWVETVQDRTVAPTVERVKAHDVVTETALLTGVTPLPARFGQIFDSDDECVGALRMRESRLLADLAQVRDLVEMRVLISLETGVDGASAAAPESPGRAYMAGLMRARGREQSVQSAGAALRAELAAIVGRFVRRDALTVRAAQAMVMLAHLVARDDVGAYRAAIDRAELVTPVRRLVVSGPGAPYQFVSPPL